GTKPQPCLQCGGSGQATTQRGFIMFASTCPRCEGRGSVVADPCRGCRGRGLVEKRRKVLVTFPAGIDSGQRLRVPGQGMPGPTGAPAGDLYVDVEIARDPNFDRDGHDLIAREAFTFGEAALGTERQLTLPDGNQVSISLPAGTQPGTILSVRDRGMPI